MKFLLIDGTLLKNTHFTPTDKMIIATLHNLSKANKGFYGSFAYLANEFGLAIDYVEKRFAKLEKEGVIVRRESGYYLGMSFIDVVNFG